jgi:hypothetical protein
MNSCQAGFVEMFKEEKKTYDFIGLGKKTPSNSEKDQRVNLAMVRNKAIYLNIRNEPMD